MKITVRHNQTEIITEIPQSRGTENYYHPIGNAFSTQPNDFSSPEKSPVLLRLLKLIETMADKVIDIQQGNRT